MPDKEFPNKIYVSIREDGDDSYYLDVNESIQEINNEDGEKVGIYGLKGIKTFSIKKTLEGVTNEN